VVGDSEFQENEGGDGMGGHKSGASEFVFHRRFIHEEVLENIGLCGDVAGKWLPRVSKMILAKGCKNISFFSGEYFP
jgi:hypothetical protein